ncbi:hypothetical protein BCR59_28030 [Klebsiella pneumoniae]|nr:hypothetical protein BCR59_28030 [Klebsiella pneumoniae]
MPLHPQRIVSMHDLDITIPLIGVAVMPFNQEGSMRWFVSLLLLLTGPSAPPPHKLKLSPMI